MKQISINDRYLAVGVPAEAEDFAIRSYVPELAFSVPHAFSDSLVDQFIPLPPGQYTIIGRQSEVEEDVAGEMVGSWQNTFRQRLYRQYEISDGYTTTALESLASFCRANGMENPLILKIDKI